MATQKTFVGPKLRQLRKAHGQTQAQMAETLGLSATYVNLLENNQRSLSVQVLMRLAEGYAVDWRELVEDDAPTHLADLRNALQDPIFGDTRADLHELRGALDHSPTLVQNFLALHRSYRTLSERLLALDEAGAEDALATSPEAAVHDLFRRNRNYFDAIERAAETFRADAPACTDEMYGFLKARMRDRLGIAVEIADLEGTLREYDEDGGRLRLAEGVDYINRVFQIIHMAGLIEYGEEFDAVIEEGGLTDPRGQARARIELANYFAAAVLMPYAPFLDEARACRYDLDRLAARFAVSYEHICHRVTTLQRDGAQGVPLFFMRIDKAGNVTKRFNATSFNLAEHGGACPRLDVHMAFRAPGRIIPQFVEMPDGSRYFTINRTVDRPALGFRTQDQRLAVTLGCAVEHADALLYAAHMPMKDDAVITPIGINCRLCPRASCAQRAQQPIHLDLPMDERRRGHTRFES